MIRHEIIELDRLGPFPASKNGNLESIKKQEKLLNFITEPVSRDEAVILAKLFGPDDYFGLAWTVLHLVESCPDWPVEACLIDTSNEWIARLNRRLGRE